jgi:hypothetical protein
MVHPTSSGQTLRPRKAATPEKEVAVLHRFLHVPNQVIRPTSRWSDSYPND